MRLYDHYIHPGPWDKDLPADLIPPIKHLRKIFDQHHWNYWIVTQRLCYSQLHPTDLDEDIKDYLPPLQQLKAIVGAEAQRRFVDHLKTGTAPAILKAFYDLYLDGITLSALGIFMQLAAVGKANEQRLGIPHLQWAESQTKNMVRSEMHRIELWVRDVCDKHIYDPNEEPDERIYWRKWQAPRLLLMKPSRYTPYDAGRIWERHNAEESRGFLEAFAEHYVIHIEARVEQGAGHAAVELAKQPKPHPPPAPEAPAPVYQPERAEDRQYESSMLRRESQRKATQEKYKRWHEEYVALKKAHPEKSDVWHSLKISRMPIAKGSSPETVRRRMKQK